MEFIWLNIFFALERNKFYKSSRQEDGAIEEPKATSAKATKEKGPKAPKTTTKKTPGTSSKPVPKPKTATKASSKAKGPAKAKAAQKRPAADMDGPHEEPSAPEPVELPAVEPVKKRPSALRAPKGQAIKSEAANKGSGVKFEKKKQEITYQNPSWHKSCYNWQLKSNKGYIMSVSCSQFSALRELCFISVSIVSTSS